MSKQRERPILFSGAMVRAILEGRKKMTRRVVKHRIYSNGFHFDGRDILCHCDELPPSAMLMEVKRGKIAYTTSNLEGWESECPYGAPGDRLWVREAWARDFEMSSRVFYRADADEDGTIPYLVAGEGMGGGVGNARIDRWRPSIHMPRWASRITLEVTGVRVERVQDISEEDAIAEGVERRVIGSGWREYGLDDATELAGTPPLATARESFRSLWDSINAKRAPWASNPYVWVVAFRRVQS